MIAAGGAIPLAEARDESLFGGKAVQLGAAVRAGLPVPAGVALSAELVEAAVAREPAGAEALESAVRALDGPLAVRSSCVGEDAAGASFAGQHETRLNVRSAAQVAEAIAAVRQSGRSAGAVAYRRKLGLDGEPRMGVVVQQLVEADVAGVLFTKNPLSGADERVIEATWGLGEAVVQGLVVPDRYRVSRTGRLLEKVAGDKPIAIRPRPDGSTAREPVAADLIAALCLDDARFAALHRLAKACEAVFEGPSDIEWAFAGATLYLLQRRRVTGMAA